MKLIRALLQNVLRSNDGASFEQTRKILHAATAANWIEALARLDENRVTGLVGAAIHKHAMEDVVLPAVLDRLSHACEQAVEKNSVRMAYFADLLSAFRQEGVEPLVLKSTGLVGIAYPELAAHQMNDVDFFVQPEHCQTIERICRTMGYTQHAPTEDSLCYIDATGAVILDIHFRFRMYERFDLSTLVTDLPARFPPLDQIRVFEPNAMLVHLIWHLNGHRPMHGYQMRWILDIAILLQTWSTELDVDRIRTLLPAPEGWAMLLRFVSFLTRELGVEVPETLRSHAEAIEPFTLEEVFRSQRVVTWRLSRVRGWLRLVACITGLRDRGDKLYPRLVDPLHLISDQIRERRAIQDASA